MGRMTEFFNSYCQFDAGLAKLLGFTQLEYAYAMSAAIIAMAVAFILSWRTYWGVLARHGFSKRVSHMAEWFVGATAAFNVAVVMARAYGREFIACPYDLVVTLVATVPAFVIAYIIHWYAGNKGSARDMLFYVSAPVAAEVALGSRTLAHEVIRVGLWLIKAAT
jgi:hypothetical protein